MGIFGFVSGTRIRLVQPQRLCLYCITVSNSTNSTIESDRYGNLPVSANQLFRVMELKQLAKKLGFSRIKPENKQHVVLETPMEEPAWNLLAANLPENLKTRFVYSPGKVTVRGLGVFKADQQLQNLIDAFGRMQGAIPEAAIV
ncbi:MAG: TRCF domain-containing protein [Nostoc sp.]